MILWKGLPLYPKSFSPVHKHLKFSAHFGVTSLNNSKVILPAGYPFTLISKNTLGLAIESINLILNLNFAILY